MRVVLALLLSGCMALPAASAAQRQPTAIEQQIERLSEANTAVVAGRAIAAIPLIKEFYAARSYRLAWGNEAAVAALLAEIDASVLDGLRTADFHEAAVRGYLAAPVTALSDPVHLAERDIVLTDVFIQLLYQLRYGKVDPRSLDPNWNFARPVAGGDVIVQLNAALDNNAIRTLVDATRLADPTYRELRRQLARYRSIASEGGWQALPAGPSLRQGMTDATIPSLRQRLIVTGDLAATAALSETFDAVLEAAVRAFQARHGLNDDGVVGPATRAALNVPVGQRIDQLRANLERARWLGGHDVADVVEVDIAGFSVERREGETITWRSRAIVGQPFRQTPVFADEIEYIVFNPTWTVPRSILFKDIIPRIRANPEYLKEQGFSAIDGQGQKVPIETVASAALENADVPWTLIQAPGPHNALGRMKFMFPNAFAVYLHDTPERTLFDRTARSFSSGCIRVDDSLGLAESLLAGKPSWDRSRIEAVIASGQTVTVFLEQPVPVHLLYRTAVADPDAGTLLFRNDIYNRDGPLIAALDQPLGPIFRRR